MRYFGGFHRSASRFVGDRRGSFAVIFAMTASVLALSVGFAVNIAQLYNAKSSLQGVIDAAVTSTARDLTTGVIKPEDADRMVKAFIGANSRAGVLQPDRIVLDRLTVNRTAKTVEVAAHVDVGLYFPLFGMDGIRRVSDTTAAVYSDKLVEVAMMLDVTGSMKKRGRKDKIGDLKTAASNAVEALLGNQDEKNARVRVAIVPYAEAVNTGKLKDTVFVEKKGGSDLPPFLDDPISVSLASRPDNCATERKKADGTADFTDDGPNSVRIVRRDGKNREYHARVNRDDRITEIKDRNGVVIGTKCPAAALVPLTADKQRLLDTIDDFEADGVTAGAIAAQWGYYMLSPKWRQAVRSANAGDGPADYNEAKVAKVAILMTDGQFNTAFAGVDGTPQNRQGDKSRSYAESICSNMKDAGIAVFTIGFDLPSDEASEARGVLKDCSSPDTASIRHFFDVSTGEELDAAFKEIIANTERLALTR